MLALLQPSFTLKSKSKNRLKPKVSCYGRSQAVFIEVRKSID